MAKKKVTKKRATKKAATADGGNGHENKSELIRAVVDSGIVKPAEIKAELSKRGVEASQGMIATVKSRHLSGKGKTKGKRGKRGSRKRQRTGNGVAPLGSGFLPDTVAAIQGGVLLLRSAGGLKEAQDILKALASGTGANNG